MAIISTGENGIVPIYGFETLASGCKHSAVWQVTNRDLTASIMCLDARWMLRRVGSGRFHDEK